MFDTSTTKGPEQAATPAARPGPFPSTDLPQATGNPCTDLRLAFPLSAHLRPHSKLKASTCTSSLLQSGTATSRS